MIVLYGFGPAFGLPDASPFVMKTEVQLKMSGLPYRLDTNALLKRPKGKLPFIDDDSRLLADSTFIRKHLVLHHGVDLDHNLSPHQRALCWAIERLLEDHLYWAIIHLRWMLDDNFAQGPAHFFDPLPEAERGYARQQAREYFRAALHAHGLGRHSPEEIAELGETSLSALAVLLAPIFDAPLVQAARRYPNLVAYANRLMRCYYLDFPWRVVA